ncbi:MAG: hypothetical protein IVW52_06430 [Acidimicrobiales bacterium]|nr:hypothetical protein [Acidimicrobiales bacterium]
MKFNRGGGPSHLVVWITVAVVVVGLTAVIVWNRDLRHASAANAGISCPGVVAPENHHPPLTALGVHRVALVGDSIMSQASCSVAESLAAVGIQTYRYPVPGTGLLTGLDWVSHMKQILRSDHPDVVVAEFVGNYFGPRARTADGRPIVADSPEFLDAWNQRARALSDAVRAAGAQMYWVSPPPMPSSVFRSARQLFEGYASIDGDHVLNSGTVLAGSDGNEVIRLFALNWGA